MVTENIHAYKKNSLAPYFVVENITHLNGESKVLKIFNYPINPGNFEKKILPGKRDLLKIPGITVNDIEASLMKGTLLHKILSKEIRIVESNINLIQFDDKFRDFLNKAGVEEGIDAVSYNQMIKHINNLGLGNYISTLPYTWRMNIHLIGIKNGINRIFYTPEQFISGTFNNHQFAINIYHNGRRLNEGSSDFIIEKSDENNIDYDVINFVSFIPNNSSALIANYVVRKL